MAVTLGNRPDGDIWAISGPITHGDGSPVAGDVQKVNGEHAPGWIA